MGAWELARFGKVRFAVLSYRNMEHVCCGTLAHFCMIEPLRRAARTTRLLLRNLGGHPPLAVDQSSIAQTALLTRFCIVLAITFLRAISRVWIVLPLGDCGRALKGLTSVATESG